MMFDLIMVYNCISVMLSLNVDLNSDYNLFIIICQNNFTFFFTNEVTTTSPGKVHLISGKLKSPNIIILAID